MKSYISRDKVILALHGWMKPKKEDDSTEPSVGLINIACKYCVRQVAITFSLETQLSITEYMLGIHACSQCLHVNRQAYKSIAYIISMLTFRL